MSTSQPAGRSPLLAVVLSLFCTGLGHVYCGRIVTGLVLFLAFLLFAPAVVLAALLGPGTPVLVGLLALIVFAGCTPRPNSRVVLYCAQDEEFAKGLLETFHQRTGIEAVPKFDTEADKSVSLYLELVQEGITSPEAILQAGWDKLVEILDRGHYVRYDFSTATKLLDVSSALKEKYGTFDNLLKQSVDLVTGKTTIAQLMNETNGPIINQPPAIIRKAPQQPQ